MDNVYILDYVTNNELNKKEGRRYTLFVDLRAAFDKVDSKKMLGYMRERERERGSEGEREESANGWYGRLRRYTQEQNTKGRWERKKVTGLRRQRKKNEKNDEAPGKVCEQEKDGSEY
jgi:hypothetical protein